MTSPTKPSRSYSWNQLLSGQWIAEALFVVAKLGVAEQLESGPRSVAALAVALGTDASALYRVMRALATVGLFTEGEGRAFALTESGQRLRASAPQSVRPLILTMEIEREALANLEYSVRTGQTAFPHVHGMEVFEYLQQHPEQEKLFDDAMTCVRSQNNGAIVGAYDFGRYATIVDVGGGQGALMIDILARYPSAKGVVFDRPVVAEDAMRAVQAAGLSERCTCVGGDYFAETPGGGDLYLMASVVHGWDDERSVTILQTCRRAMRESARLVLIEMVIPPGDKPFYGKFVDLKMLVVGGGRERTEAEFRELLARGGFALQSVTATPSFMSLLEAVPLPA